jgi:hypothetical protein
VADCEVCHDQGQHKQGVVRLKDADGGTTIQLNGGVNPLTDSTEAAKLTAFCLACHGDGLATADPTPFTTGATIPLVTEAAWTAGAHENIGSISCYGDGSTFGCHASGHGSEKLNLLAPYNVAVVSPDFSGEEEGLCFNCHDSDGPAADDIQALFALTNQHPVVNSDTDRPANGRAIECTVCHLQHSLDNSPVHTDGNLASGKIEGVAGVNASGSLVSSITYEYELCFKCHSDYAGAGSNPGDGGADTFNKRAQFNTGNTTFHPVMGAQDNAFATGQSGKQGATLHTFVAPWNQTIGEHDTMWCTDCHGDTTTKGPHGSDNPNMLRASLTPVDAGDGFYTPLCVECHFYDTYVLADRNAGESRFGAHNNSNHMQPNWTGGYGGCLSCHYGGGPSTALNVGVHGISNGTQSFLTGSRIVSADTTPGSENCTVVTGGNSGCNGHSRGY